MVLLARRGFVFAEPVQRWLIRAADLAAGNQQHAFTRVLASLRKKVISENGQATSKDTTNGR
jgi:hypothetical protein